MPKVGGKKYPYTAAGMKAAAAAKGTMVKRTIDALKGGGLMKQNPFAKKKKSSAKSSTAKRTSAARAQAQSKRATRAASARAKARAVAARMKAKKRK